MIFSSSLITPSDLHRILLLLQIAAADYTFAMLTLSFIKLVFVFVIGVLSAKRANSFHTSGCITDRISKSVNLYTNTNESYRKPFTQLHQSIRESHESSLNVHALTRRKAMIASLVVLSTSASPSQRAYADVSDGNSLPKGAQQFARTIKLKTDIKVSYLYG